MVFSHRVFIASILALCTASCGISTPSANTIREISGTIPVGGNAVHSFSATKTGEVEVTITSLTPTPSNPIQLTLGQQSGANCTLLPGYVAPVVVNRVVQFGSLTKADYCLIVYDTAVLTAPTSYTGRISHP